MTKRGSYRRSYLGYSLLRYSMLKVLEGGEMNYSALLDAISGAIKDDPTEIGRLGSVLSVTIRRASISGLVERSGGKIRITNKGMEELRKMDLFLSRLKGVA